MAVLSSQCQLHFRYIGKLANVTFVEKVGKKRILIHHEMIHTLMKRRSNKKNKLIGAEQPQWDEHRRVDLEIFCTGSILETQKITTFANNKHHQPITTNAGHLPSLSPVA